MLLPTRRNNLIAAVISIITLLSSATASSAEPLLTSTFGALPPLASVVLSPKGDQAVALRPIGETYHVTLIDLENGASKILMAADPDEFAFNWCRFANDKRVVCSIRSYITASVTQDISSNKAKSVATRLLAINTDGSNRRQLVKEPRTRLGGKLQWRSRIQDNVVSWLPEDPKHILLSLNRDHRVFHVFYHRTIMN